MVPRTEGGKKVGAWLQGSSGAQASAGQAGLWVDLPGAWVTAIPNQAEMLWENTVKKRREEVSTQQSTPGWSAARSPAWVRT